MSNIKIGLEIHGYLQTKEKLFCRCLAVRHSTKKEIKENTNICPICSGQPGCKPMLPNAEAIKKILQIALMFNCEINKKIIWQRKHYNWPDLPKGYQDTISGAYAIPNAINGSFHGIRIREVHLEEDPAAWNPETGYIDYNRSGLPLVEIVTEPDFKNPEQVENWLKNLLLTLSYIHALDKNAGIKADVNVSTEKTNFKERIEIKNMSSIENIKKAILYEAERQANEPVVRETRRFDEKTGKTIRMRSKEEAEDYRFIPEPDLPVIKITEKEIKEIKENLPETPEEKLDKLVKKHKINKKKAEILHKNFEIVEFFEEVAEKISPDFALPWVVIELLRVLNYNKKALDEVNIKPEHFAELLEAVKNKELTELKAKQILNEFIPDSFSIKTRIKKDGMIDDKKEIEEIIKKVLEKNQKAIEDYKQGKKEALNFLLGEVMKTSKKRADFHVAREMLVNMMK